MTERFLTCLLGNGFLPTVTIPTRITSATSTLIDNIFINDIQYISKSGAVVDDTSDHLSIFLLTGVPNNNNKPHISSSFQCFDYRNVETLAARIQYKLNNFDEMNDPDLAAKLLTDTISTELSMMSTKRKRLKHQPIQPWIHPSILCSINTKNKLHKKFICRPNPANEASFKQYRNILNKTIKAAKNKYYKEQLEENKDNPKRLWGTLFEIINKKKGHDHLPAHFEHQDKLIHKPVDIAEGFNNFFSTIGGTLEQNLPITTTDPLSFLPEFNGDAQFQLDPIGAEEVAQIILTMNMTGAGFDGINAKLLKKLCPYIIHEITYLMNLCLQQKIFPKCLKIAVIKPIYKSGHRSSFTNYRPISILPTISKVLEII